MVFPPFPIRSISCMPRCSMSSRVVHHKMNGSHPSKRFGLESFNFELQSRSVSCMATPDMTSPVNYFRSAANWIKMLPTSAEIIHIVITDFGCDFEAKHTPDLISVLIIQHDNNLDNNNLDNLNWTMTNTAQPPLRRAEKSKITGTHYMHCVKRRRLSPRAWVPQPD